MAMPGNRFDRVEQPDPASVTVSIGGSDVAPSGAVVGPRSGDAPGLAMGQDGTMTALQALAAGCHLANQLGRQVVVIDPQGRWNPAWGRLVAA